MDMLPSKIQCWRYVILSDQCYRYVTSTDQCFRHVTVIVVDRIYPELEVSVETAGHSLLHRPGTISSIFPKNRDLESTC